MNDREILIELIGSTEYGFGSQIGRNFKKSFIGLIADSLIKGGVTIRKHGRCDVCSTKETGTGSIGLYGTGWQVAICNDGITHDLVINHNGEQIYIPISYCPECGAWLDADS